MSLMADKFEAYQHRYENIRLEREDGILVITFHTAGGEFVWSALAHEELGYCFNQVNLRQSSDQIWHVCLQYCKFTTASS